MRFIHLIASTLLCFASTQLHADGLPNLGQPENTLFSQLEAQQLGQRYYAELQKNDLILDDPIVNEYLQQLGNRIAAHAHEGEHRFTFFAIQHPDINAFAVPGGYIGVFTGLIAAAHDESELAGVLAHEVAHITQNHSARQQYKTQYSDMLALVGTLAAVATASATDNSDAAPAIVAGAQGLAVQQKISYTRKHEQEADRVAVGLLHKARLDPFGLVRFLSILAQKKRINGSHQLPELLLSHPLDENRIAETIARAEQLTRRPIQHDIQFDLIQQRVIHRHSLNTVVANAEASDTIRLADRYRETLELRHQRKAAIATTQLEKLKRQNQTLIVLYIDHAEALIEQGHFKEGFAAFDTALTLFPNHTPLLIAYSKQLIQTKAHAKAKPILEQLAVLQPQLPFVYKSLAICAASEQHYIDAYLHMAQYHLARFELKLAKHQLQLAETSTSLSPQQTKRLQDLQARLKTKSQRT